MDPLELSNLPLDQESEPATNIPTNLEDIESDLRGLEVPQELYTNGLLSNKAPAQRISYLPGGFTPETVLLGDLMQISDPDVPIPTLEGRSWPEKTRFCFKFCNAAYNTPVLLAQQRVRPTRGAFAILAAQEIKKMLTKLPEFPFALDQIKVLCIDVCSRGTLQPRIFVDGFRFDPEKVKDLTEMLHG